MSAARRPLALGVDPLPATGPAALTMGVFDGVHRGHQALLQATEAAARARGIRGVAIVFDPHPDEVLRPGTRVPRLAPLETNLRQIEDELGLDVAIPIRFDAELRGRTAEEFLAALAPAIELRVIVMSPESAFGRGRGGTVERLRKLGTTGGFEVMTVEPVLFEGAPISSMRIRQALAAGDVAAAAAMGRPPGFAARVAAGGLLEFGYLPAMPASGAYRALLHGPAANAGREVTLRVDPERPAVRIGDLGDPPSADGSVEIELLERL